MLLAGCSLPRRSFEPAGNPDELDDTRFLHYLASMPVVTVDEGARAVLMLVGDTGNWSTPSARWSELMNRGAVRSDWRLDPGDTLDMGTLAFMISRVADVPRGVNSAWSRAIGMGERRYALRACIAAGVLPQSRAGDPVRGGVLVTALTKVGPL
jgi:hypothetical protein